MKETRRNVLSIIGKAAVAAGVFAVALTGVEAVAQTKIKVGRTTGASGFHIPAFIAMHKGFFKKEGLDAEFVSMTGKALVTAGIGGAIDFVPIPGGGSEAMLKGAPLVFIVGQSMISQWTLTTTPDIKRVEDLKGKTIGLGRPGSADYSEVVVTLGQHFNMEPGKDYKVIAFTGEPDRIAAMINGSIQGGALSFPHAARAEKEGMKVLIKTGDYIPRLGGSFLTHKDNLREKRDITKRFIRAIAKADSYIRTNKQGTIGVIKKYFEIEDATVAESIYKQVATAYGPDLPPDLIKALFESRATPELGWPAGKPLPDLEQFVARDLLNEVLKEMGKKPTK